MKLRSWRGWSETKQQKGSSGADRERKTNNNKPTWTTQGKRKGTQEHRPGLFGSPKAQEPPKSPKARGLGPDMVPNTLKTKNQWFFNVFKNAPKASESTLGDPKGEFGQACRAFHNLHPAPKASPDARSKLWRPKMTSIVRQND